MMRKLALAAVLAAGFGGTATAADIYVPPAVSPVYAPVPTWAGHYYGLQGGIVWGDASDTGIIGVLGGWNWQNGSIVYGLDLNANYAFGDGFLGNIRGRLGYTFAPSWLVYGTAGVAGSGLDGDFDAGFTVGGGLEYAAWDHANLRLDYAYTDAGSDDAHTLMLGVVFRGGHLLGY